MFNETRGQMISAYSELSAIPSVSLILESDWYRAVNRTYECYVDVYPFSSSKTVMCVQTIRDAQSKAPQGLCVLKLSRRLLYIAFQIANFPYGELFCVDASGQVFYASGKSDSLTFDWAELDKTDFSQKLGDQNIYFAQIAQSSLYLVSTFSDGIVYEVASVGMFSLSLVASFACASVMLIVHNPRNPYARLCAVHSGLLCQEPLNENSKRGAASNQ